MLASALVVALTGSSSSVDCGATVAESRTRAAELFASGDAAGADACLSGAMALLTSQLEALAAEAEALRSYRDARRLQPATTSSCVLDAQGVSVCLEGAEAPAAATAVATRMPDSPLECSSEGEMQALLQRVERGELDTSSALLEEAVQYSAYRHWWVAARGALDVLRTRNVAIGSEVRQAVTTLRDEAGSVLNLMRQTKMDEATINCAVMWAQGESSVNLLIKFAARLDAPVTVLNVDNEQVLINATHVTFSGIGRQKPKRYQVHIELFAPIVAENSSWNFGSVGTVRFRLAKAAGGDWPRLTASTEPVKNHRVWWEGQEQIAQEEKKLKREEQERRLEAERQERAAKEEEERKEREVLELAERQAARERRAQLMPLLEKVLAASAILAAAPEQGQGGGSGGGGGGSGGGDPAEEGEASATEGEGSKGEGEGEGAGAGAAEGEAASAGADAAVGAAATATDVAGAIAQAYEAATQATAELVLAAEEKNETTVATASQLLSAMRSLASTGYSGLTKDALQRTRDDFEALCSGMLPAEPKPEPSDEPQKTKGKKKKKKKRGAAGAAKEEA